VNKKFCCVLVCVLRQVQQQTLLLGGSQPFMSSLSADTEAAMPSFTMIMHPIFAKPLAVIHEGAVEIPIVMLGMCLAAAAAAAAAAPDDEKEKELKEKKE
jgi:hypothetical protein